MGQALAEYLDPEMAHGLKIEGEMESVLFRSPPAQEFPYKPFSEIAPHAPRFLRERVRAILVGILTPEALQVLTGSGVHLHGLTENRDSGGHVLDLSTGNKMRVSVTSTREVNVIGV